MPTPLAVPICVVKLPPAMVVTVPGTHVGDAAAPGEAAADCDRDGVAVVEAAIDTDCDEEAVKVGDADGDDVAPPAVVATDGDAATLAAADADSERVVVTVAETDDAAE